MKLVEAERHAQELGEVEDGHPDVLTGALADRDARVRERAVYLAEILVQRGASPERLAAAMAPLADDPEIGRAHV
mgnify:CR=1 FL=1